eukprot:518432_1
MSNCANIFCVLLPIAVYSFTNHNYEPRIVNGIPTTADNYPFIVDIREYFANFQYVEPSFCTGSLIRLEFPATILTAAHCLWNITNDLAVYLLRSDQDANRSNMNNFTFHIIWKNITHPNYNNDTQDNDIALLFLNEDLSSNSRLQTVEIQDLDYNTECCETNELLQVIGYGAEQEGATATDTLEYANKKFMLRNKCSRTLSEYYYSLSNHTIINDTQALNRSYIFNNTVHKVTQNMICAMGNNTDACQGDSGGPLIKTGTNIQVGITSYGVGCNNNLPGVYTNVGVYKIWINQEIENILNSIVTTTEINEFHTTVTNTMSDSAGSYHILISIFCMMLMSSIVL